MGHTYAPSASRRSYVAPYRIRRVIGQQVMRLPILQQCLVASLSVVTTLLSLTD